MSVGYRLFRRPQVCFYVLLCLCVWVYAIVGLWGCEFVGVWISVLLVLSLCGDGVLGNSMINMSFTDISMMENCFSFKQSVTYSESRTMSWHKRI